MDAHELIVLDDVALDEVVGGCGWGRQLASFGLRVIDVDVDIDVDIDLVVDILGRAIHVDADVSIAIDIDIA